MSCCISLSVFISAAIFLSCVRSCVAESNETDKEALLEIKAKISDDPLDLLSSWNDTFHFCNWYGVYCNTRRLRVIKLDLHSSKLTGTISPYIGNLSLLRVLNLQNNTFRGTIPSEVGRLHSLQHLLLNNNSIHGVIPSNVSGCFSLVELRLEFNKLAGDIPDEIGSLPSLQLLSLPFNSLSGTIPSSLGKLSSLTRLSLSSNNLMGTVPDSLGKLKNLTLLSVSQNKLSGIVPASVFNLTFLETLDLGENSFQGSLPWDLGFKLPNLDFFSISNNNFTGIIPASISNLSKLEYLLLNDNKLHGQVPSLGKLENLGFLLLANNSLVNGMQDTDLDYISSLANASMLQIIDATLNDFKGNIPRIICNFTMLYYLGLESNQIDGEIPSCIDNLVNLQVLHVGLNNLSGIISQGIGKLLYLSSLDLGGNRLSGSIPSSISNLTQLTLLDLSENNLHGSIPSGLGNCRNLLILVLSQNNLSGEIPPQLFGITRLSIELDLSRNQLSGSLPAQVGQLSSLGMLDVSHNMLSGQLPSALGACLSMEMLYLEKNLFEGTIPDALEALKGLTALDLSQNKLSGNIPKYLALAQLKLQMLNLSYNNLEGGVPTGGVFNNVTAFSVVGNSKLCGGQPELKLHKCNLQIVRRKAGLRKRLIVAILVAFLGVILLGSSLVLSYAYWCRKKKKKGQDALCNSDNFLNLSYQSLLEATNGFSAENMIGNGAFGVVYKGILVPDSRLVANKVFKLGHHGASKSFMTECGVLCNIRHRHLVKVITACSSTDHQGNDFKALVYEYMANGSLEEWLHPVEQVDGVPKTLNFNQRLDTAVDVAFALEYLHHHCDETLVHCDIKPSNILLDGDMVAHVSDFGLAKFLSESVNHSSSVGIRGTVGYTPPEYGMGNEVSTHGDVYSFGILIQEMFTGKRASGETVSDGQSVGELVKEALLANEVTHILDQALLQDINSSELEAVICILKIGLSCSAEVPKQRLDMMDVAASLSSIRTKLHATRQLIPGLSQKHN